MPCEYSSVSFFFFVLQSEQGEQVADAIAYRLAGHQVHPADEGEILAGGEIIEQRQVFGDNAHVAFGFALRAD